MKMKKLFAVVLACTITLLGSSVTAFATDAAATEDATATVTAGAAEDAATTEDAVATTEATVTEAAVDPYSGVGSYMAFFQCQTTTWVYRNDFVDPKTGYGSEIFKTVYNNETEAPTSTEIQDTVIDGDGEYTISLNNISFESSTDFNMVAISTNIPLDAGIEVTAASLSYGTKEITSTFMQKEDNKDYVQIMLINQYSPDMKDTVNTMVPQDGTDMIITFTVSGFGYEKTIQEEATTDAAQVSVTPSVDAATASTDANVAEDTSASATGNMDDNDANDNMPITGIVIGILAGVLVIIGIVVITIRRKKK